MTKQSQQVIKEYMEEYQELERFEILTMEEGRDAKRKYPIAEMPTTDVVARLLNAGIGDVIRDKKENKYYAVTILHDWPERHIEVVHGYPEWHLKHYGTLPDGWTQKDYEEWRKKVGLKHERCQIAHDITKDILQEQCKIDDDKCKIAKEITEDIVSMECDREDVDDAFYNFLQKDFEEAGYYVEYVNEDINYMYFKLIDKKTNKKSRIIELSNDRLCKEVSAGRSKYLAKEVIGEM